MALPTPFKVVIIFMNGSTTSERFTSAPAAYEFANSGISYSGGRVQSVFLLQDGNGFRALWHHDWSDESKSAGLRCPP